MKMSDLCEQYICLSLSLSVSLSQLATTYVVELYGLKDSATSKPARAEVTTMDNISPPRRIRLHDVRDSSVTLTWRSKSDPISGFLVEATPVSSSGHAPIQRHIDSKLRSYTVTAKPAVVPPGSIQFTSLTPSSVSFTWEPSTSPGVTGYYVTYEEAGGTATEYVIRIVTLQNNLRSTALVGKAKTQLSPDQFLIPELPQLLIPEPAQPGAHRPPPEILDVPETNGKTFNTNHVQFSGTGSEVRPGQQGPAHLHRVTELGPKPRLNRPTTRQPLIYIPVPGPDGTRVPLVKVSDGPLSGLAFGFPDNETELAQEARTITTISWEPIPQSSKGSKKTRTSSQGSEGPDISPTTANPDYIMQLVSNVLLHLKEVFSSKGVSFWCSRVSLGASRGVLWVQQLLWMFGPW
ncbi:hypothetical protein CRUP_026711, partial [Coryphaenoides rupestris]